MSHSNVTLFDNGFKVAIGFNMQEAVVCQNPCAAMAIC